MTRRAFRPVLVAVVVLAAGASVAAAAGGSLMTGPATQAQQTTYQGYYDGHKDTYLITDVSSKSQASALHVNYAPALAASKGLPLQWFVQGKAAKGQLTVFGSEPGEKDYNPLWTEVFVTWKPGVKPVLLVKDDQIDALEKAGKLSTTTTTIVLNAPITKVGK